MPDRTTFAIDGRDRTADLLVPEPGPTADVALLVLHGSGQTGRGVRRSSGATFEQPIAGRAPAVAYPDAFRGLWNDARSTMRSPAKRAGVDDVAFLTAVVQRLREVPGVRRVVVVGYSNGGQMALRLAHERPEALDGLALIGTTQPTPDVFAAEDRYRPVPVLLVHGTRDPIVPYDGGMASLFGFRPRGTGLSAPDTAAYYARRNGISATPTTSAVPPRSRSRRTSVEVTRYAEADRPPVTLYGVRGGGHVIPNPARKGLLLLGRTSPDIDAGQLVAELATETSPTAPVDLP